MTDKKESNGLAAKIRGLDERLCKAERVLRGLFSEEETPESEGSVDNVNRAGSARCWLMPLVLVASLAVSAVMAWDLDMSDGEPAVQAERDATTGAYNGDFNVASNLTADSISVDVVTATGVIDGVPVTGTVSDGEISSATTYRQTVHEVIDISGLDIVLVSGGGVGTNWLGSKKIFDFPIGLLKVESCTAYDVIMATNLTVLSTEGGDWALGTASNNVASLTMTNAAAVDLCPSTSCDPWVSTNTGYLVSSVHKDGSTTAIDMYYNVSVDTGDLTATTTVSVTSGYIAVDYSVVAE